MSSPHTVLHQSTLGNNLIRSGLWLKEIQLRALEVAHPSSRPLRGFPRHLTTFLTDAFHITLQLNQLYHYSSPAQCTICSARSHGLAPMALPASPNTQLRLAFDWRWQAITSHLPSPPSTRGFAQWGDFTWRKSGVRRQVLVWGNVLESGVMSVRVCTLVTRWLCLHTLRWH